jgi:hypothetical protein
VFLEAYSITLPDMSLSAGITNRVRANRVSGSNRAKTYGNTVHVIFQ